jgi:hypothetical protein
MAVDRSVLESQVMATVAALKRMEGDLENTKREVQNLGFIARSFVERDISGATGRNFGEWLSAASNLRASLERVQGEADGAAGTAARAAIATELPRIRSLHTYLESAPQKITKVPGAVLKPQQRTEILNTLQEQDRDLVALESQLLSIDSLLSQAG